MSHSEPDPATPRPAAGEAKDLDAELLALLKAGRKIEAIKLYRSKTSLGLKEAKDAVEALAERHGIEAKGAGCAGVLLFALLVVGAGWLAC